MTQFDILSVGELAVDRLGSTNKINDNPSSTQLNSLHKFYGGRCGNFAVFASLFKAKVTILSPLGDDFDGRDYKNYLEGKKIDTSNLFQDKNSQTATYFGFSENEKLRGFFYPGTAKNEKYLAYTKKHLNSINSTALYCTSSHFRGADSQYIISHKAKIKAYAPSHNTNLHSKSSFEEIFQHLSMLFVNEQESHILERLFKSKISSIASDFGIKILVKTMGRKGCQVIFDNKTVRIPICKPDIVADRNGAGDALAGAFMANYLKTSDPIKSAMIGSATASFVVEKVGCQSNVPTLDMIERRIRKNYKIKNLV